MPLAATSGTAHLYSFCRKDPMTQYNKTTYYAWAPDTHHWYELDPLRYHAALTAMAVYPHLFDGVKLLRIDPPPYTETTPAVGH